MHITSALLLVAVLSEAPTSVSGNLADMYAVISGDIVAAARAMPEAKFDYRPTPDVRSFGQIVGHLLGSQFIYCAQAKGLGIGMMDKALLRRLGPIRTYAEAPTGTVVAAPSKETILGLLDEGMAFCKEAYGPMTDAAAVEMIGKPGRLSLRLRPLMDNVAHNNLHYGNLVTYLRLNGLVPPSTERQKQE
jgi:hypothetical protein